MTDSQIDNDMAQPAGTGAHDRPADPLAEVRADRVEISQGGASSVTARQVTISQGGAGRIRATEVSVSQGGVGVARTDRLALSENAGAFAVVAREATVSGSANVFLLVAGRTNGPVRTAVDIRAAAAFGAAFALVLAVLRRIR